MAEGLGRAPDLPRPHGPCAAQILRAGDVPLSVGAHPYGPRAQLHPGRRDRPLQARPRLQRAAPHGLGRLRPAGRERGDGEEGPSQEMGLREHRHHEGAAQGDGPVARLEPRARVLRSVLLPPPAEDVPRLLEGGAGLPQGGVGQLGSRRQYRAGQRAGDRGQGLAHRRAGRAAHAHPVEPQDHQVRRRAAEPPRHARALAREGAPDAGQLDRQEPRRARLLAAHRCFGRRSRQARDLHHAARHALRRFLRGAVARTSAGHRTGREGSGPAALRRRKPQDRHRRGRGRDRGEDRLQAAAARQASADAGQDHAGLCRQLRADGIRHRRHLRLPRPRRARPRIRDEVRPADHPGGDARGRRSQELQRRRRSRSSRTA